MDSLNTYETSPLGDYETREYIKTQVVTSGIDIDHQNVLNISAINHPFISRPLPPSLSFPAVFRMCPGVRNARVCLDSGSIFGLSRLDQVQNGLNDEGRIRM